MKGRIIFSYKDGNEKSIELLSRVRGFKLNNVRPESYRIYIEGQYLSDVEIDKFIKWICTSVRPSLDPYSLLGGKK